MDRRHRVILLAGVLAALLAIGHAPGPPGDARPMPSSRSPAAPAGTTEIAAAAQRNASLPEMMEDEVSGDGPEEAIDRSGSEGSRPEESGRVRPHPINRRRSQLMQPRFVFEEVKLAILRDDLTRARAILREQAPAFTGWIDHRIGYQLIVDCLEADVDTRDALVRRAETFLTEFRASSLRRHVRRTCL